jgi:hypothetical protein
MKNPTTKRYGNKRRHRKVPVPEFFLFTVGGRTYRVPTNPPRRNPKKKNPPRCGRCGRDQVRRGSVCAKCRALGEIRRGNVYAARGTLGR